MIQSHCIIIAGIVYFAASGHMFLILLHTYMCVCVCAQSCPTLCDPRDCSSPGSSVHEISQARILEWVVISFSRGISLTQGSHSSLLCFLHWQADSLPLCHLGIPHTYIYTHVPQIVRNLPAMQETQV